MSTPDRTERWRRRIHDDLWKNVVPFWRQHSPDPEHGGYFNCLDHDGTVFDTKKHVWLQGRQVWMLSKLFAENRDDALLQEARAGAEFLAKHATLPDGRALFVLGRDGAPAGLQRKIFSECFLVMAFAEYARASGDAAYRARAMALFDRVLGLIEDPSQLGRPVLAGTPAASDLATPMILLNLVAELRGAPGSATFDDRDDYDAIERDAVRRVMLHFDRDLETLRETVRPDGTWLSGPEGRLLNPGHAIEAAWFLAQYSDRIGDRSLLQDALTILRGSLELGWDEEHGGIHYFLDAEGYSPTQLEWPMKLWWPHCEAMVGTLVAWKLSGYHEWLDHFERIATWTLEHFPDAEHGEWFGYLDREGRVSQRFKGGPYKGFFHVPRALMMCEQLLRSGA